MEWRSFLVYIVATAVLVDLSQAVVWGPRQGGVSGRGEIQPTVMEIPDASEKSLSEAAERTVNRYKGQVGTSYARIVHELTTCTFSYEYPALVCGATCTCTCRWYDLVHVYASIPDTLGTSLESLGIKEASSVVTKPYAQLSTVAHGKVVVLGSIKFYKPVEWETIESAM